MLDRIGRTHDHTLTDVNSDIVLLWLILDSNQWSFIKDPSQSSAEEKLLIQAAQQVLVQQLVQAIGQEYLPNANTVSSTSSLSSAASSSSSSSSSPSHRSVIDIFHCIRMRLIDLIPLTSEASSGSSSSSSPSPSSNQLLASKTSVALLITILIRAINLQAQPQKEHTHDMNHPVILSFIYHILSLPFLAQRLRVMQLQPLIPSFLTQTIWDRCLQTLTFQLRQADQPDKPASSSSSSSSSIAPYRILAGSSFASVSYSGFDSTSAAFESAATRDGDEMEIDYMPSTVMNPSPSPPPINPYTYFSSTSNRSRREPRRFHGLVWIFGNLLDLVDHLDETKSPATSLSFSHFLTTLQQLIRRTPKRDLPNLAPSPNSSSTGGSGGDGGSASSSFELDSSDANHAFPPQLVKQFSKLQDRAFIERLCRRLMAVESIISNDSPASSSSSSSPSAALILDEIPVICQMIDTMLYHWSTSSNTTLNHLVFSTNLVPSLWSSIRKSGLLDRILLAPFTNSPPPSSDPTSSPQRFGSIFADNFFNLLPLFTTLYSHLLMILDDEEFFTQQKPFSLQNDIVPMVHMLKILLYHLYWSNYSSDDPNSIRLRHRFHTLFHSLRQRQSRKSFLASEDWLYLSTAPNRMGIPIQVLQAELSAEYEMRREMSEEEESAYQRNIPLSRVRAILTDIPFALPFQDRLYLLYQLVDLDKTYHRQHHNVNFDPGLGVRIRIRRKFVLEDAFRQIAKLDLQKIKGRIQVEFTDEHGIPEPGLDGGGLWRELLSLLLSPLAVNTSPLTAAAAAAAASSSSGGSVPVAAFDPSFNLWSSTPQHFLYPNPDSLELPLDPQRNGELVAHLDASEAEEQRQQILQYYFFLGQMIGKALYDGIQIEPQFALFFLRSLVGDQNYVDDLQDFDPTIYSNLMKLKSIPMPATKDETDPFDELGLTFSIDRQVFDMTRTYDLLPNGSQIPVTSENKVRFIYLIADYYLNKQSQRQMQSFRSGILSLIKPEWLRMFAAEEMRLLISGSQSTFNRQQLQQFTQYSSGYSKDHELIRWFWEIVHNDLTDDQLGLLLKFVTSCSRAPILGFQHLQPQLCIQVRRKKRRERERERDGSEIEGVGE